MRAIPEPAVVRLAEVFRLLAEPNRLRILCSLGSHCRPVSDIIRDTGIEQTNASFHLRVLREAGLVRPERRGPFIYYCVHDIGLLEHLQQIDRWVTGAPSQQPKSAGAYCAPRRSRPRIAEEV